MSRWNRDDRNHVFGAIVGAAAALVAGLLAWLGLGRLFRRRRQGEPRPPDGAPGQGAGASRDGGPGGPPRPPRSRGGAGPSPAPVRDRAGGHRPRLASPRADGPPPSDGPARVLPPGIGGAGRVLAGAREARQPA